MISKKNLDQVRFILDELKKSEKNCGACGQFFNKAQADEQGFHLAIFCDAHLDPALNCECGYQH
jgi:hypothetical protein